MSGLIHPQDVIAALYEVVGDDRLARLDDLLTDAGFMRRCPCTAMAPADGLCPACGGGIVDFFDVYRCTPEAEYTIDPAAVGDPVVRIGIAAAGGGEVGDAYAGNGWIYGVWLGGQLWYSGADLRSGATPQTHAQMAALLACSLADGNLPQPLSGRLTLWAHNHEPEDCDV